MGPLRATVRASYGILADGSTAVIEMASASGLALVDSADRNPLKTTSYGTGELIRAALAKGIRRVIVGVGGSATCDGGAGLAQALGIHFYDRNGRILRAGIGGGELHRIASLQINCAEPLLRQAEILIACDVNNRLLGRYGAAPVFGPQKGASQAQVEKLERGLKRYAAVIRKVTGLNVARLSGGGAAGGAAAGLVAFAGATLRVGSELVIDSVELAQHLIDADVVITGEGRIDAQTAYGKAPLGVAALAKRMNVPVIAVGGCLAGGANKLFLRDIDALESAVVQDASLDFALRYARRNLVDAGERIGRWLLLAKKLNGKRTN
jgi:glycerate kinase